MDSVESHPASNGSSEDTLLEEPENLHPEPAEGPSSLRNLSEPEPQPTAMHETPTSRIRNAKLAEALHRVQSDDFCGLRDGLRGLRHELEHQSSQVVSDVRECTGLQDQIFEEKPEVVTTTLPSVLNNDVHTDVEQQLAIERLTAQLRDKDRHLKALQDDHVKQKFLVKQCREELGDFKRGPAHELHLTRRNYISELEPEIEKMITPRKDEARDYTTKELQLTIARLREQLIQQDYDLEDLHLQVNQQKALIEYYREAVENHEEQHKCHRNHSDRLRVEVTSLSRSLQFSGEEVEAIKRQEREIFKNHESEMRAEAEKSRLLHEEVETTKIQESTLRAELFSAETSHNEKTDGRSGLKAVDTKGYPSELWQAVSYWKKEAETHESSMSELVARTEKFEQRVAEADAEKQELCAAARHAVAEADAENQSLRAAACAAKHVEAQRHQKLIRCESEIRDLVAEVKSLQQHSELDLSAFSHSPACTPAKEHQLAQGQKDLELQSLHNQFALFKEEVAESHACKIKNMEQEFQQLREQVEQNGQQLGEERLRSKADIQSLRSMITSKSCSSLADPATQACHPAVAASSATPSGLSQVSSLISIPLEHLSTCSQSTSPLRHPTDVDSARSTSSQYDLTYSSLSPMTPSLLRRPQHNLSCASPPRGRSAERSESQIGVLHTVQEFDDSLDGITSPPKPSQTSMNTSVQRSASQPSQPTSPPPDVRFRCKQPEPEHQRDLQSQSSLLGRSSPLSNDRFRHIPPENTNMISLQRSSPAPNDRFRQVQAAYHAPSLASQRASPPVSHRTVPIDAAMNTQRSEWSCLSQGGFMPATAGVTTQEAKSPLVPHTPGAVGSGTGTTHAMRFRRDKSPDIVTRMRSGTMTPGNAQCVQRPRETSPAVATRMQPCSRTPGNTQGMQHPRPTSPDAAVRNPGAIPAQIPRTVSMSTPGLMRSVM